MRILIYGAGVIGSLYAAYLSESGYSVSLLARGKRLNDLKQDGLRYFHYGKIRRADVTIIEALDPSDCYDYIFLTVREEQLCTALTQLRENASPTVVTMVNTIEPYAELDQLCGNGKLLPAFPGAGGGFTDGILDAGFTPHIVQPTTFGEIDGRYSERVKILKRIFAKVHIPHQIVKDMQIWQVCHLAMVVPLADAYYMAEKPQEADKDKNAMRNTAGQLHENFTRLHQCGILISPPKLNLFRLCPVRILSRILPVVFRSKFGNRFMFQHAMKAKEEMHTLHDRFYSYLAEGQSSTR